MHKSSVNLGATGVEFKLSVNLGATRIGFKSSVDLGATGIGSELSINLGVTGWVPLSAGKLGLAERVISSDFEVSAQ